MISRRDFVSGAGSVLAVGCLSTSAMAVAGALATDNLTLRFTSTSALYRA
jgi:hypothetical protein